MNDFDAWAFGLDLRYFAPHELYGECGPPPRELWDNIVATAVVADELRHRLGSPIAIGPRGSYRDPDLNRQVGGAARSQHMAYTALDLSVARLGGDPYELWELACAMRGEFLRAPFRPQGRHQVVVEAGPIPFWELGWAGPCFQWRGGIGLYSWGIHIDTRGRNANWHSGSAPRALIGGR